MSRLVVAVGPLGQESGAAGQLGEAVDDGGHGLGGAATEKEIVQLIIARLERVAAVGDWKSPPPAGPGLLKKTP
jgi:hypothetical protein